MPLSSAVTTTATRCPGCGSGRVAWTETAGQHNFLCKTCGTCWHPATGQAERVDPLRCPGCSLSGICRAACC